MQITSPDSKKPFQTPPQKIDIKARDTFLGKEIEHVKELQKNKWKAVAKIVALVTVLLALFVSAIALIAPTPIALVLIPLAAVFVVGACLPAAKKIKQWVADFKSAKMDLEKLKQCQEALSDSRMEQSSPPEQPSPIGSGADETREPPPR